MGHFAQRKAIADTDYIFCLHELKIGTLPREDCRFEKQKQFNIPASSQTLLLLLIIIMFLNCVG